jgi:hydroxyacylglutathione hydrolase
MTISIRSYTTGPMGNNVYLLADHASKKAVLVDPSFDSEGLLKIIEKEGLLLSALWLTHAHFDHLAGVGPILKKLGRDVPVGIHPADLPLYHAGGGAANFGLSLEAGPEPKLLFEAGQNLSLGENVLEVRYAPGHTPGHVIFYQPETGAALVGDVIFRDSVGRTDLPGGSWEQLLQSIQKQVLTLPPETRLLSGHGPETTVEREAKYNPFLSE